MGGAPAQRTASQALEDLGSTVKMIDTLVQALQRALVGPVDTLLYVGAGPAQPAVSDVHPPRQMILVEGDTETYADLVADLQHSPRSGVRALHRVVLPHGGAVMWHRHNVRRLNSPHAMEAFRTVYPRLTELCRLQQEGVSLAQLASEVLPGADIDRASGTNVLVLDVPGQETALLSALPKDVLCRFRCIAIRATAVPLGGDWAPLEETVELLGAAFFKLLPALATTGDESADEIWPVAVLQFDEDAFSRSRLQEQCRALETALAQARALLSDSERTAASKAREFAAELQDMERQRDEQSRLVADMREQVTNMKLAMASAETRAAMQKSDIDALRKAQLVAESLAKECSVQLKTITQDRDAHANRAAQLQVLNDELAKRKAAAEQRLKELVEELSDRESRLGELGNELSESSARFQILQNELLRAEGQLDLVKELLLRDPSL